MRSPGDSLASSNSAPTASSVSPFGSLSPYPSLSEDESEAWQSDHRSPGMLDSMDLALLSHYLTHTSRVIPFDEDDLYALQVGIPNLAFNNKPLMASLLALAAACKCNDIIKHSSEPLECLGEIRELLVRADRHHRDSLRQIQAAIPNTDHYGHVLANAALMVLYCSASHCVRVRLVEAARLCEQSLPSEVLPAQSQWISLIRAAHTAFAGLLNSQNDFPGASLAATDGASWTSSPPRPEASALFDNEVFSPEDGPSQETRRLFFPIVASTWRAALEKLRTKSQSIAIAEASQAAATQTTEDSHDWQQLSVGLKSETRACLAAIEILEDVIVAVFPPKGSVSKRSPQSIFDSEFPPFGHLSEVAPWLWRYLARVTSAAPSKPLRRTVMAFVNRVPLEYLSLVQSILDLIPVKTGRGTTSVPWETVDRESPYPSATHLLAMDIFAHWLVLVMLLDGVWWVAGIGEWELGRVVSFTRTQACLDPLAYTRERWWPESMLKVKKELEDHSVTSVFETTSAHMEQ